MKLEAPEAHAPLAPLEKILLVDDRPANLLVYKNILEELGQTLITAPSGEDALKLVLKHDFAVILLDVNMPTLNGFDTAALIRKRRKSAATPIIFLTAFNDDVDMAQGYASGAVDYLPTPVVPEVLKAKVRVFIELSQMRKQAALQAEERVRREAAEESAQKSAFLAQVSDGLARSQTQVDLLRGLVQLPVPQLADVAIAWFRNEGGQDRIEWNHSLNDEAPSSPLSLSDLPWLETLVARTLATGQPQLMDEIAPYQPAHIQDIPFTRITSAKALPLAVPGQIHGVLILACVRSRPANLISGLLASDLAYRVGIALENVMLMEQIREADRRKDEFLGMLAHELRNPLSPIVNCLQLQKMLPPTDPAIVRIRDTMTRQVQHMGRLIDDLLDATRLAHGKILLRKERSDFTTIVAQTAEDYRSLIEDAKVTLILDLPDTPVWVDGDPTRLVQAVGNLLNNASKFNNPGGSVKVSLKVEPQGSHARLSVADTGIGIEPSMLRYVFDVFRQAEQGLDRSRGGLGLGLALVKGLVGLHDGEVEVTSEGLNKGTEFIIRLPVAVADVPSEPIKLATKTARRPCSILVVDDNRDAAESMRMLLQHDGHKVDIAFSAQQGLEQARSHRPEIILCDIGLPIIDGYQVIRSIRQEPLLSDTYVIALTGYGREEDQRQALDAGFDLHMTKPIDHAVLMAALDKAGMPRSASASLTA